MNNNNRIFLFSLAAQGIWFLLLPLYVHSNEMHGKYLMVGLKYARYKWKKELQENWQQGRRSCTHIPFVYGHNLIISWFKLYIMVRVVLTWFQLLNQCSRSCNSHWTAVKCNLCNVKLYASAINGYKRMPFPASFTASDNPGFWDFLERSHVARKRT